MPEKLASNCRVAITAVKEGLRSQSSFYSDNTRRITHQAAGLQSNSNTCAVHVSVGYMRETLACLRWWL